MVRFTSTKGSLLNPEVVLGEIKKGGLQVLG